MYDVTRRHRQDRMFRNAMIVIHDLLNLHGEGEPLMPVQPFKGELF